MKRRTRWNWLFAATCLMPLFSWSCASTFRDAVVSGGFDFVAGSVTTMLATLLPVGAG